MSANISNGSRSSPRMMTAYPPPPPQPPPQPLPPPQSRRSQRSRSRRPAGETVKLLISEFNDYGHRTTVHGLGHMYQSTDIRRKFFWLCITIVGCIACGVHIYFIVSNYNETPVNSVILNGGVHVTFPDVTLCNMYPISESAQLQGVADIRKHMQTYWKYFRGFINSSRGHETRGVERRKLVRKFFQIFWVSDDTRDLAHDDDLFLVYCKYKGMDCSNRQFKMIQNIDYWNCYTFTPKFENQAEEDRRVYSSNEDEGLNLILYTNTHLRKLHANNGLTVVQSRYVNDKEKENKAYEDRHANFVKRYLVDENLSWNQLLAGDKMEPDGIRVILHERGTYPHMDMNSVIVGNGDYSNIIFEMQRKTSKNRPEHQCRETTDDAYNEEIEYVSYYPGKDIRYNGPKPPPNFKKFRRQGLDYVVERIQELFWTSCGCYTHIVPFQHFNSLLCYHCKNGTDPVEIERTLSRAECHDGIVENELQSNILNYYTDSQRFQPCTSDNYNVKMGSSVWPSQRDIKFLINQYVIPKFQSEYVGGKPYNRILKHTKVYPIRDIINIMSNHTANPPGGHVFNWTVEEFLIRKSFLKVAIHADSPTGTLNLEVESYSFVEALSEIGGIFGLYAGVSLLTFFEFVELAYLMAIKPKEVKRQEKDGKSKFTMLQSTIDQDDVPQQEILRYQQLFDNHKCCSRPSNEAAHTCKKLILQAEREDSVRRPVRIA